MRKSEDMGAAFFRGPPIVWWLSFRFLVITTTDRATHIAFVMLDFFCCFCWHWPSLKAGALKLNSARPTAAFRCADKRSIVRIVGVLSIGEFGFMPYLSKGHP